MSLSRPRQHSPFPFVLAAVLLGVGAAIAGIGSAPAWWQLLVLVVCAGLAATALIVPALRAERRSAAERAERDARVISVADGIDAALARLHAATAEAQLLTEQNLRQQSLATELTAKLNAVADAALEKINQATLDASGQIARIVTRSVEAVGQAAQSATSAATAAIDQAATDAATRFANEADRHSAAANEQLQARSDRVAANLTDRAAPLERLLAELPGRIAALETLADKISSDSAHATRSLAEARAAALAAVDQALLAADERLSVATGEVDSALVAARAALTTAAEEQTVFVRTAAETAGESLKTLARDLEARLKSAAEPPVRPAPVPKAKPAATDEAAPVQLILGETVAPAPLAPASPAAPAGPRPTALEPAPVVARAPARPAPIPTPANPQPAGKINPVDFAGERAYDDLASAMDDALSG